MTRLPCTNMGCHTSFDKIGIILCDSNRYIDGLMLATWIRECGVPVDWRPSVSIKAQLAYCKRKGFGEDLIYIENDIDNFTYQDCREYESWILEMSKSNNFEKKKYPFTKEGCEKCVKDNLMEIRERIL